MVTSFRFDDAHDLHFKVHFVLTHNPYLNGRRIDYEIDEADVTLKGVVRSYYQKQMAQESLRRINGIRRISNEIAVVRQ
jgi:osmotically-inducible protein OsmY